VFDLLDPGCNGKLLVSKLLDDEFLEERYQVLRAFIEPSDIEEQYEDDMNEGYSDDDGVIIDERYSNNNDWDDDDIQVATCIVFNYSIPYTFKVVSISWSDNTVL